MPTNPFTLLNHRRNIPMSTSGCERYLPMALEYSIHIQSYTLTS